MDHIFAFFSSHQQMIFMLILMVFVGIEVIGHVPSVLHTPLMSGANAIHGVGIVGAILVLLNTDPNNTLDLILGTLNVVGGFVVTDRMLEMFKKKPGKK